MASITIELSDNQLQTLQALANAYGVSLDVLLRAGLEDWLNGKKAEEDMEKPSMVTGG